MSTVLRRTRRRVATTLRTLAHRLHPLPGPTLPATAFRVPQVPTVPRVHNVDPHELERHITRRYGPTHGTARR